MLEVQDHRGALSGVEDANFFAVEEGSLGGGRGVRCDRRVSGAELVEALPKMKTLVALAK